MPSIPLYYHCTAGSKLNTGLSSIAAKEDLRRSSWVRSAEDIGAGLERSELYASSTVQASCGFSYACFHTCKEFIEPKLGGSIDTRFHRIGDVFVKYASSVRELAVDFMVSHESNVDLAGHIAYVFDLSGEWRQWFSHVERRGGSLNKEVDWRQ